MGIKKPQLVNNPRDALTMPEPVKGVNQAHFYGEDFRGYPLKRFPCGVLY